MPQNNLERTLAPLCSQYQVLGCTQHPGMVLRVQSSSDILVFSLAVQQFTIQILCRDSLLSQGFYPSHLPFPLLETVFVRIVAKLWPKLNTATLKCLFCSLQFPVCLLWSWRCSWRASKWLGEGLFWSLNRDREEGPKNITKQAPYFLTYFLLNINVSKSRI